jgi:hypothetical protein
MRIVVVESVVPSAEEEILVLDEEVTVPEEDEQTFRSFLPVVQGSSEQAIAVNEGSEPEAGEVSAAFTHVWLAEPCSGVSAGQSGLWDGVLGSGLFWLVRNDVGNEQCAYFTQIPGSVLTTNAPQLRMRLALSEGSSFSIRVYRLNGTSCTTILREYTTTLDDNQPRTYSISLPVGYSACRVQIRLSDDPDSLSTGRAAALIDYIQLRNPTTSAISWQEIF